ncbi:hypothetical protein J4458_02375 [Candidatus Woesearchaeota archaeon]|nr:hypothetical protein [Candidatus Woesearchaeota archaeon]
MSIMRISLGRLKSPLSYSELTNVIIRGMKIAHGKHTEEHKELVRGQYAAFLRSIEQELNSLEKVAERVRVLVVRLEESLKSFRANMKQYRKKIKKYPHAGPYLRVIDDLIRTDARIRKALKAEARRAAREDKKIRRNI